MDLTSKQLKALEEKGYSLERNAIRNSQGNYVGNLGEMGGEIYYNPGSSIAKIEKILDLRDVLKELRIPYRETPSTARETIKKRGERWINASKRIPKK